MFGTIIVVLPSRFTGGEVCLSYGGLSVNYDGSTGSHCQTTVMSWYTGVAQELKPITDGHRLVLVYNLVHSPRTPRPALSLNEVFIQGARNDLIVWKNDQGSVPQKLLCLLRQKYPQHDLRAGALKGGDSQRTTLISTLAKELGFHVGLATVECHLAGMADRGRGYKRKRSKPRRRNYDYELYDDFDDDFGGNDGYVEFGEIEERTVSVKAFVDLDGAEIADTLEFDEETETVPSTFCGDITSGLHDEQEYGNHVSDYFGCHNLMLKY